MISSLRMRLLIATSLCSAAVLALLGAGIYLAMRHLLLSDYDASLLTKARAVCATVEQHGGRVKSEFDPNQMPEFSTGKHPDYFEIWLDNGQFLARSPSLERYDLPMSASAARDIAGRLALPHTHHARAVILVFTPRQEEDGERRRAGLSAHPPRVCTICVAGTPEDVERMLEYLGWLLLAACGGAIVVSGALLLRIVSRAVRPVNELARQIGNVRETDLGYRLGPGGIPLELAPVVEKLNGLLGRLEEAFGREKAFTADVAHELRTPLAGLLATLEVCRSRPRGPAAYEVAIDECRTMTERMQAMVENLLLLARADAGQLRVERQCVNVEELLTECWSLFESRADARKLHVEWDTAPDQSDAQTDPDKLRIIIQNLFENAVSYTQVGGGIRVEIAKQERELAITVANTGSRVAAADVAHVFKRFWRGDQNRSDTGVHCGLGLSLSQRLMHLLGGELTIDATLGGEFIVRITLPAASGPASGAYAKKLLPSPAV
ncbi:MAG TPA: ATP-binding protein [Tepidisphaeraceae bacterium]|nr:ATP-binding protein [Tepidisphaeraceae bacterium]